MMHRYPQELCLWNILSLFLLTFFLILEISKCITNLNPEERTRSKEGKQLGNRFVDQFEDEHQEQFTKLHGISQKVASPDTR